MTGSKMLERLRLIKQTCTCLFILVTLLEPLWYYYLLLRVLLSRFQIFHDALESIGCHLLLEQRLNSIWFCQLSLGDARAYFLSTAKNELGVVSAESIAGEILLIFWEINPYKWLWLQFIDSSLQFMFMLVTCVIALYSFWKISVLPFFCLFRDSSFSSACFSLGRDTIRTKEAHLGLKESPSKSACFSLDFSLWNILSWMIGLVLLKPKGINAYLNFMRIIWMFPTMCPRYD